MPFPKGQPHPYQIPTPDASPHKRRGHVETGPIITPSQIRTVPQPPRNPPVTRVGR